MSLKWSEAEALEIARLVGLYPKQGAALLPVLYLAQEKFGHLSPEVQLLVADTLSLPPTRVREVVTFYEMFHEHAEAQVNLEVCTNISCHLMGADRLMEHLEQRLGIKVGHQTEDGVFELKETECLASCGSGPCLRVGNDYYEHLTTDAVDALIQRLREAARRLEGRSYRESAQGPHTGPVAGFAPKGPSMSPSSRAPSRVPSEGSASKVEDVRELGLAERPPVASEPKEPSGSKEDPEPKQFSTEPKEQTQAAGPGDTAGDPAP